MTAAFTDTAAGLEETKEGAGENEFKRTGTQSAEGERRDA